MKDFIFLLRKEFQRIFSNTVLMAVFFGAPILYGVTFGFVYEQAKILDLAVVIVDEDHTSLSTKIIDAVDDNESLQVLKVLSDDSSLPSEMPKFEYAAIIAIPSGFEGDVMQKRYPEVQVNLNTSNLLTANFASRSIQTVLGTINAGVEIQGLQKQGKSPFEAASQYEPFKVNFNRLYNPSSNYLNFMYPGILATIMQQVIFLALALVFARDIEDGYFKELIKKSSSPLYHIILKAVPFLLLTALMWAIVASFFPIFGISYDFSAGSLIILITLFTLASMLFGMLVSVFIPSQLKSTEVVMILATPSFLLSGYTWPPEAMPVLISKFAEGIPLTHLIIGFRKLAVLGGTIGDVQHQLKALILMILICFLGIYFGLKWKIDRERNIKLETDDEGV